MYTRTIRGIILLILIVIGLLSMAENVLCYPPRDHVSWCYWCGGDGFINMYDPPTIYGSDPYQVYNANYYGASIYSDDTTNVDGIATNENFMPLTNKRFTRVKTPCRFELCGSNSNPRYPQNTNFVKFKGRPINQGFNCTQCHTLNRRKSNKGSRAINKDIKNIKCDFCHNFKRFEGGAIPFDTASLWDKQFAGLPEPDFVNGEESEIAKWIKGRSHPYSVSAHPYRVKDDDDPSRAYVAGNSGITNPEPHPKQVTLMQCTSCHENETQATLPDHKNYKTRFRLRGGSTYSPDFNPLYPVETTSLNDWLTKKKSDVTGSPTDSAPIGNVSDDLSLDPVFKRNDGRAKAFYSINFCLQCHDRAGKFGTKKTDSTTQTPDIATSWMEKMGGHYVRQIGKYLKPGDRIPCTVCHDPHSSNNNAFLLKDIIFKTGQMSTDPLVPRRFCQACHPNANKILINPEGGHVKNNLKDTTLYNTGRIYNYETSYILVGKRGEILDPILEGIVIPAPPGEVDLVVKKSNRLDPKNRQQFLDKRKVGDGHTNDVTGGTCIGPFEFTRPYYYVPEDNNKDGKIRIISNDLRNPYNELIAIEGTVVQDQHTGCHQSGHNPARISCEGCHTEEFDWKYYSGGAGKIKGNRKQDLMQKRPNYLDFIRHPVYVSIYDYTSDTTKRNYIDIDKEIQNWFFDPVKKEALKKFLFDSGLLYNTTTITDNVWPDVSPGVPATKEYIGKRWNPPKMEGNSQDVITCQSCHIDHNTEMKNSTGALLDTTWKSQSYLRMDMPVICLVCHRKGIVYDDAKNEVRASKNRHGGYFKTDKNSTGKCNTCHSMHGRHVAESDTTRAYELHFGMFKERLSLVESTFVNDTTYDGQQIYIDKTGLKYARSIDKENGKNRPYIHLLNAKYQVLTCGRCHGPGPNPDTGESPNVWKLLGSPDTTGNFYWPPNILYPAPGGPKETGINYNRSGNYNREDTYFDTITWRQYIGDNFKPVRRSNKSGSEHDIDLYLFYNEIVQAKGSVYEIIPASGERQIYLRCGYCHDPHGNDNYVQLRATIPIEYPGQDKEWTYNGNFGNDNNTPSLYNIKNGMNAMSIVGDNKRNTNPSNYRNYYYTTGIVDFCTSCHLNLDDGAVQYSYYRDRTPRPGEDFDTTYMMKIDTGSIEGWGNGDYTGKNFVRHPTNFSMRGLINRIKYKKGDTTNVLKAFDDNWDKLVLQRKCSKDSIRDQLRDGKIIGEVVCLTCHNAHASNRPKLRKDYDYGINSCINICHPYIKYGNVGSY